jgi:glycosyltransferase involved in cell wall biosynthesis
LGGVFSGKVDGIDASVVEEISDLIRVKGISRVWVDGSNLGFLCKQVKARFPAVEVFTLFHNCEARFFLGAFRHYKSVRSFGVLVANYLAERLAVRNSDRLVCLNGRDSRLLLRLYGRGATDISAIALRDRMIPAQSGSSPDAVESYVLFVGGGFYANTAGISWYAKHVAQKLPVKTLVVGMGLESVKADFEQSSAVEVIGEVDDLVPFYLGASFVVAPIFDGSGMKTKVAEALMFGKRIVGTAEAFTGYEDVLDRVGVACGSPEDFIHAIKEELGREERSVRPELRVIYEQKYSFAAARGRLARILGEPQPS